MGNGNQRRTCEFQLLRYVPDTVRTEYVHIGVILREQGSRTGAQVRFTRDWRRVRCLDPDADTALLEGLESELRRRFQEEPEGHLRRLLTEAAWSYRFPARMSQQLRQRSSDLPEPVRNHAWKAQRKRAVNPS